MRDELRGRNTWRQLVTALIDLTDGHGELLRQGERRWTSATFSGTRHTVALIFAGSEAIEAGERLIAQLPDHEFTLSGQLVVDAAVAEVEQEMLPEPRLMVELEMLLLDYA